MRPGCPAPLSTHHAAYSSQRSVFRPSLLILMSGVALLLVVACANLANLLMARSSTRQRELAVRLAVGAGRGRIARQMLDRESVHCYARRRWRDWRSPSGQRECCRRRWQRHRYHSRVSRTDLLLDLRVDPRILAFAIALCVITAMLSGLAPALAAQRIAPASALRANRTLGLGRFGGPSSFLLIAQVAVSLVLLIGAGLFIASLRNLRTEDLGLGRERELFVWTLPGQTGVQRRCDG